MLKLFKRGKKRTVKVHKSVIEMQLNNIDWNISLIKFEKDEAKKKELLDDAQEQIRILSKYIKEQYSK